MAGRLLAALAQRHLTVACAESLTGGLLAAQLTGVPGASQSFAGGIVAYATASKHSVLGVPAQVLASHGPVSGPTAAAMAAAVRFRFDTDVGLATTGVAGPEAQADAPGAPVGLVFVAVATPDGEPRVRCLRLAGDREGIRRASVAGVLEFAVEVLAARE